MASEPTPAPAPPVWNWCPPCGQAVDADDVHDGSEVECHGCGRGYVVVSYTDGTWGLDAIGQDDEADEDEVDDLAHIEQAELEALLASPGVLSNARLVAVFEKGVSWNATWEYDRTLPRYDGGPGMLEVDLTLARAELLRRLSGATET